LTSSKKLSRSQFFALPNKGKPKSSQEIPKEDNSKHKQLKTSDIQQNPEHIENKNNTCTTTSQTSSNQIYNQTRA
jgi:hypothetical protein